MDNYVDKVCEAISEVASFSETDVWSTWAANWIENKNRSIDKTRKIRQMYENKKTGSFPEHYIIEAKIWALKAAEYSTVSSPDQRMIYRACGYAMSDIDVYGKCLESKKSYIPMDRGRPIMSPNMDFGQDDD